MQTAFEADAFQTSQLAFQINLAPASSVPPTPLTDVYAPVENLTGSW